MNFARPLNASLHPFNEKREREKQKQGIPAYRRGDFFYDISSPMNKISSDFSASYLFDRLTLKGAWTTVADAIATALTPERFPPPVQSIPRWPAFASVLKKIHLFA